LAELAYENEERKDRLLDDRKSSRLTENPRLLKISPTPLLPAASSNGGSAAVAAARRFIARFDHHRSAVIRSRMFEPAMGLMVAAGAGHKSSPCDGYMYAIAVHI